MKLQQHLQRYYIVASFIILAFLLVPQFAKAQTTYKINSNKSSVKVLGTSNVHDWTMTANGVESQGSFTFNSRDELTDISGLNFTVLAKSLKSQKSSMDSRTYTTIKADEYPKITYKLKTATVTMVQANKYKIETTGNLTIAGVTQLITTTVMALVLEDHSISCHGSEKLKLTDYKINPPSFMLGAMKVGDGLTIQFDLNFKK
jgi:polyisoprenoid-binding protein YceI